MKQIRYRIFLVGIMVGLVSTGCAAFSGGKLEELETLPEAPEVSSKANLTINWETYMNGVRHSENEQVAAGVGMKHALAAFKESGYFSEVGSAVDNPDLQIRVKMQDQGEGSMGRAFLTGLTLYLIPSSGTDHYVMDAEVTHVKSGETKKYHLEESLEFHQQLFLIFIMPFNTPGSVAEEIFENMFKHLAMKIQEDGLLKQAHAESNPSGFEFNLSPVLDN